MARLNASLFSANIQNMADDQMDSKFGDYILLTKIIKWSSY